MSAISSSVSSFASPSEAERGQKISDLGEFGLISKIKEWCPCANESLRTGIGDDAALIRPSVGEELLFCSDMLTEGIHFDLNYTPLQHLGYKAMVASISDIAAMNGRPTYALLSLALSNRFTVEDVGLLYKGIRSASTHYKVGIAGGDTVSSSAGLTISVALLGMLSKEKATHRSGAAVGDLICVTGDLGAAYVGLEALQQGQRYFSKHHRQPDLSPHRYAVGRYLRPEARTDLQPLFVRDNVVPTAMIDISDGLVADLLHLCTSSKVGCVLEAEKLPISPQTVSSAGKLGLDPLEAACYGGEDYELLFTLSSLAYEQIKACDEISCIGHITSSKEGTYIREAKGNIRPLEAKGWNHFSPPNA